MLILPVNCFLTFMTLIKKICEQISLIRVAQGVAVWHVSVEVVSQVHNQITAEGFGLGFFPIMLQLFQNTIRFFWLRSAAVIGF